MILFELHRIRFTTAALYSACLLLLMIQPALAAPPSPGTVISPIDKPVFQPERKLKPEIKNKKPVTPVAPRSNIRVEVNKFRFKGNTTYSDQILEEVVANYEGKKLSIADIYHAADLVEIYYRYHGFLLTSVYVPAQQINSGSILLEVIEGRLGSIRIDGDLDSYTQPFLIRQVDELKPGEIIDDKTLEKETLLLDDLPGLTARAVISPGQEYGTSDVIFKTEEDRFSGVFSANNFGRKSIGEKRIEAGLLIANPIWQGDQLNLSLIAAEDSRMLYGRADYDALVNTQGTRLGFSYSAFNYDVDTSQLALPAGSTLDGSGETFVIRATHPLLRGIRNNLNLTVDVRRSETSEGGNISVRPDTGINLLEIFVGWDHLYHDYARTQFTGGVITNFKKRSQLTDSSSQKFKLTLDLRHYQPFWEHWFVIAHLQGVYSPDPLVDVEKFRIGGQGSVRAFPSAEVAGDKGGAISLDIGKNFILSDKLVLSPRIFVDSGKVFRIQPVGVSSSESLSGYGAGATLQIAGQHNIDLEVVEPISNRQSSDNRDTRLWLSYRGFF